jgi:drug/metabolite transporter (DMT)-like permease
MNAGDSPPQRRERVDGQAVALLVVCCVLWGLNQVAAKVALAEVPPLTQAALRSLGGAVLVLLWARMRGIALWRADRSLRGGLVAGVLFACEFACIFVGLQFTSASRMVVFIYLSPFVVALGMPLIARGERLSRPQWAGLVAAFAGVAWAFAEGFSPGARAAPQQWLGDLLGLGAALFWGATTLAIRGTHLGSVAAEKTLLYQLALSGLLLALAVPLRHESWPDHWSALTIWSLGFQIVVVSFASYLTWFWLVRHYPATRLAAFTLLTPMAGLGAGVYLLGEPLTLRLVAALVAVVTGLVLVNRR